MLWKLFNCRDIAAARRLKVAGWSIVKIDQLSAGPCVYAQGPQGRIISGPYALQVSAVEAGRLPADTRIFRDNISAAKIAAVVWPES